MLCTGRYTLYTYTNSHMYMIYMHIDLSTLSTLYCMLFYHYNLKPSLFTCSLWSTYWVENLFKCCKSLDLLICDTYTHMCIYVTVYIPCKSNPCINEGTCIKNGDGFKCHCKLNYGGKTCQCGYFGLSCYQLHNLDLH